MGFLSFLAWFLKPTFETNLVVKDLKCPLLIIHGDRDTVVPIEQGKRVFELAQGTD